MHTIEQLESHLKCVYPKKISSSTQDKRKTNILAIQGVIRQAIKDENLTYQANEERMLIYTTSAGEKIFIQYPGKESSASGAKKSPLDFRPKIMTPDGSVLRDLVFADLWRCVEDLSNDHHKMLQLLSCIFFQLGRMLLHKKEDAEYQCELLDSDGSILKSYNRKVTWYRLDIEKDIVDALNYNVGNISVDDASISFEAFICFFDLLLQNEDSKYYSKKGDLTSGRIPTSDSMVLLSGELLGSIRLSVLLQRFVSGFGVAHCKTEEIEPATGSLVHIVDRKQELISFFEEHSITYRKNASIQNNGKKYSVPFKIPDSKIVVLTSPDSCKQKALASLGWNIYTLDELENEDKYQAFQAQFTDN